MRVGNRVPGAFFETTGTGESDVTIHAGSYHLALHDAGIEMTNIMTYSSILPGTATLRERPAPGEITHGCVMETISAVAHAQQGETATAGIVYAWLLTSAGARHGGLVCEYNGPMQGREVFDHLRDMLDELYLNGYEHLTLGVPRFLISSITPEKKYGTALAALCFTDYEWPVIGPRTEMTR